jgi:hypothetical protein
MNNKKTEIPIWIGNAGMYNRRLQISFFYNIVMMLHVPD